MAQTFQPADARQAFAKLLSRDVVETPIGVACFSCREVTASDMAWECGYCSFHNTRTSLYSFLNKCQKCERAPAAFVCPVCEKTSFLDATRNGSNPARRHVRKPKEGPPVKIDLEAERRKAHDEKKEALERRIELEALKAKLDAIKNPARASEETPAQKAEKELTAYFERIMIGNVTAKDFKAKLAEKYKDDPDMLAQAEDVINQWLEERML